MSRKKRDPFDLSHLNTHLTSNCHKSAPSTPQSNFHPSSFQSPSRIPLYLKNGIMPHHQSPMRSSPRSAGSSSSCGIHDSGYTSNHLALLTGQTTYHHQQQHQHHQHHHHHHPVHHLHQQPPLMPPYRIVPQSIHIQHQQHMLSHITPSRKSSPSSRLTTPLTSGSNTPNSSHRASLTPGCVRSATLPAKLPTTSNLLHTASNTAKGAFRYDEYMPLCELQRALKKGQVLEGVLRINPKNYEDAYISAPGEEMDIYVVGTNNRNRAFNGDLVAVKLNQPKKWKIRYEVLKDNWNNWKTSFKGTLMSSQVKFEAKQVQTNTEDKIANTKLVKDEKIKLGESKKKHIRLLKKSNNSLGHQNCNESPDEMSNESEFHTEDIKLITPGHLIVNDVSSVKSNGQTNECDPLTRLFSKFTCLQSNITCNSVNTALHCNLGDDEMKKRAKEEKKRAKKAKRAARRKEQKEMKLVTVNSSKCTQLNKTTRAKSSTKEKSSSQTSSPLNRFDVIEHQCYSGNKFKGTYLPVDETNESTTCYKHPNNSTNSHISSSDEGNSFDDDELPRDLCKLTISQIAKFPFGKWCIQKTGKVVNIIQQNHSRTCGGLIFLDSGIPSFAKFIPVDTRLPRILIPYSECPKEILSRPSLYTSTLFLAQITDWPTQSKLPFGKIVNQVGNVGEIESESKIILVHNDVIDEPFPQQIEDELNELFTNWTIDDKERSYRRNFTDECVFTIDPLAARDLDDALSITPVNPEQNCDSSTKLLFDVGVHIADVSFFIAENSLLDEEAQRRSTSYYLVHKVIHMLPRIIAEKACSLTPGEEKLSFSVVWRMDEEGTIYNTWFGRSIIRSSIKLAYEHALQMIENVNVTKETNDLPQLHSNKWTIDDICTRVNQLHKITCNLRRKRLENGALEINKTKFSFVLDSSTGLPTGFASQVSSVANSLVEELMLLANISVATKIYHSYPKICLLRCHPPPDPKLLRDLTSFCSNYGIKIDPSTSRSLEQSLAPMKYNSDTTYKVVSHFLLRAMQQASYFSSGQVTDLTKFHHFALNEPFYTHFTSPIRRYPDIIVHRLLAASLGYTNVTKISSSKLQQIANHCNKRKTASRLVSESSQKLFLLLFIKSMPLVETAVVIKVLDRSFDAIILTLDIKCRVYLHQLDEGTRVQFNRNSRQKCLSILWRGQVKPQVISSTSQVKLLVSVAENFPLKVNAVLLPP